MVRKNLGDTQSYLLRVGGVAEWDLPGYALAGCIKQTFHTHRASAREYRA